MTYTETQKMVRTLIREHIDATGQTGRELAVQSHLSRSTLYRFLAGEDVRMGAIEQMLHALGYRLVIMPVDTPPEQ